MTKNAIWAQMQPSAADAPRDCRRCARLAEFRAAQIAAHPDWHNAPVNGFGDWDAGLMVLGLAPGLRGANRTGRPFTGDGAGEPLYATLIAQGFASGGYGGGDVDDLRLIDCRIVNAVRCLPPENKPNGDEMTQCRSFLEQEWRLMRNLRVVVCLGWIAHKSVLRLLGYRQVDCGFAHGAEHAVCDGEGRNLTILDSYHCSRYNTQTRRLTPEMFTAVFRRAQSLMGS